MLLIALVVLLVAAFPLLKWALGRYIESEAFRATVNRTSGASLHADVDFAPFRLLQSDLRSDGMKAQGDEQAAFASAEIRGLHASWSMRKLLDRVCQLESVEVEEVAVALEGPRLHRLPGAAERQPGGSQLLVARVLSPPIAWRSAPHP